MPTSGIVYVLSNEAMPGYLKIGKTTQGDVAARVSQLNNTSVPFGFDVVYAAEVDDVDKVEQSLHAIFDRDRCNPKREFFTISAAPVIKALQLVEKADVTPQMQDDVDLNPECQSPTAKLRVEFWTAFREYATNSTDFANEFTLPRPGLRQWYNLGLGNSSYLLSLNVSTQKKQVDVGVYIPDNKDLYRQFKSRQAEIASFFGESLEWKEEDEAKKACRFVIRHEGDIFDRGNWKPIFEWLCCNALKFKEMIRKFATPTSS